MLSVIPPTYSSGIRLQPQDPKKREKGENERDATLHTSTGSLSPHPLQERRGLVN